MADTDSAPRRLLSALFVVLLPACAGAAWLAWAQHEYRGLDSCRGRAAKAIRFSWASASPFCARGHEHNAELGQEITDWRHGLAIVTAVLAGAAMLVVAFLFGAGLWCND